MGFKLILVAAFLVGCATAQNYRICIPTTSTQICQNLDNIGSQVICERVETKVDCAIKIARGAADIGIFSEEEIVLLGHQQPSEHRVVASIRDVSRPEPFAFEAVAVVPFNHTGGLEGLRGGKYCHPGFDQNEQRWSPRVLKAFELAVARTDRCPDSSTDRKTAEELEVDTLSKFFTSACRPGPWSANTTVDNDLRNRYPSLCSLCGENANCSRYTLDMGVTVAGIQNTNRHIQALECLRSNNNGTVAYVAWQHVREFFTIRNPQDATSFALICEDGSLRVLTTEVLTSATAPCSFVKQPWSTIVASSSTAAAVQASMREWWPNGANPGGNSWQSVLFNAVIGGANARLTFEDGIPTTQNYTSNVRNFTTITGSSSCIPARRWCTISAQEHNKCTWIRSAAYTLGIEPAISCQQRSNIFECLTDIRDNTADFTVTPSNYGYLSRQHYRLSSVKLVQNSRSNPLAFTRVAALLRESSTQSITRFENLRGKKACFPEFGGISYVAFVRAAHERGVISSSECDYGRAVGEFLDSACAPGALDNSHALTESNYNATNLCSLCKSSVSVAGGNDFTCAYDETNMFYGNNGSILCLADPNSDIAFVELQNIESHLRTAGLQQTDVRMLCRNNTLAASTGVTVDQNCLLAYVVDSEVLARRNDPLLNSLNTMLDSLEMHFGYSAANGAQLINLEMYSPFDGISDLLFKDTAIGLSEPSSESTSEPIKNYNELFQHLESCTGSAAPLPGLATRSFVSFITLIVTSLVVRFVMN
ncbi:transferrin-like [Vanessa tameamea]|uniref:Transferrin-like n=1 Tax=Vanessa tameamea TaxID=334116 RepID=A0ABM4AWZ3_VANTA